METYKLELAKLRLQIAIATRDNLRRNLILYKLNRSLDDISFLGYLSSKITTLFWLWFFNTKIAIGHFLIEASARTDHPALAYRVMAGALGSILGGVLSFGSMCVTRPDPVYYEDNLIIKPDPYINYNIYTNPVELSNTFNVTITTFSGETFTGTILGVETNTIHIQTLNGRLVAVDGEDIRNFISSSDS